MATGTLGGSDLISVSSAIARVPDSPGKDYKDTVVAMTLGPGMIDCIHDNVANSTKRSGVIPTEADTKDVANTYPRDTG